MKYILKEEEFENLKSYVYRSDFLKNLLNELIKFNLDTKKKIVEVDIPIKAIVVCLEEEFCVFENEYETLVIKIDGKTLTTYINK